ncbi:hypothetical protein GCM10009727_95260 [Actinomadura napierensis]|uniref:Uncharacterized protein n=1 Tax=Actinomadura napierensis TaxID=267854 RepID=A0ABP5M8Y8_9ACTN
MVAQAGLACAVARPPAMALAMNPPGRAALPPQPVGNPELGLAVRRTFRTSATPTRGSGGGWLVAATEGGLDPQVQGSALQPLLSGFCRTQTGGDPDRDCDSRVPPVSGWCR